MGLINILNSRLLKIAPIVASWKWFIIPHFNDTMEYVAYMNTR